SSTLLEENIFSVPIFLSNLFSTAKMGTEKNRFRIRWIFPITPLQQQIENCCAETNGDEMNGKHLYRRHCKGTRWCLAFAADLILAAAFGDPATHPPAHMKAAARVEVGIKEWEVPTPGSHPHDPAVAPDGAAWYTGQEVDKLGRLDPKTGV